MTDTLNYVQPINTTTLHMLKLGHFICMYLLKKILKHWLTLATCDLDGSVASHTLTHSNPYHSSPLPPHPVSPPPSLQSHSPLSLRTEQRCLSRSPSSSPPPPTPIRYLHGDNHGNSSTVGTGHQLTKIDSRKMEGKKERKGSLRPRRPVSVHFCVHVSYVCVA